MGAQAPGVLHRFAGASNTRSESNPRVREDLLLCAWERILISLIRGKATIPTKRRIQASEMLNT